MPDSKPEFMGKVTASVTHELQNVLAVIKESAGLMEDLIMMMNQGNGLSGVEEKFATCLGTIKSQAYRGVSLTSNLNAFAHSPDYPVSTFNPAETIKKLMKISERIFRLKGAEISFPEPDSASSITTDLLAFQMLLFACLEALAITLSPKAISLNLQSGTGQTIIHFSVAEALPAPENSLQESIPESAIQTCQRLGGRLETTIDPAGICLTLPDPPQ